MGMPIEIRMDSTPFTRMDFNPETSLLAKALMSVVVVLGLTAIAERVSTRLAGMLSGAPMTIVLIYVFVGIDLGTDYVVQSAPHALVAVGATLTFVLTFYFSSLHIPRYAALASPLLGLAAFLAVTWGLARVPFTLASAFAVAVCACALVAWLLRTVPNVAVERPVRFTTWVVLVRAGFTIALVVGVIAAAKALGPRWTGLLTGFPATLLPTLVIVYLTYGAPSTYSLIRNFPIGLGSIVIYIMTIAFSYPRLGVYGGTAASLALAFGYLIVVAVWGQSRLAREATQAPGG